MVDFSATSSSPPGRRDTLWVHLLLRMTVFSVVTVLVALVGPFGTYDQGAFADRLVYWSGANGASFLIAAGLMQLMHRVAPDISGLWREAFLCIGLTVIFTPFLAGWTASFFPGYAAMLPPLWRLGGYVFGICVCLSLLRHGVPYWVTRTMQVQAQVQDAAPEPEIEKEDPPRLLERLDGPSRSPVQRLSVDGHKVQIVMKDGAAQLRMRFSDAVAEMDGVPGFPTHRSHWVAESAIAKVRRSTKGRPEIMLHNGDTVPVSQSYEHHLQDRGLI